MSPWPRDPTQKLNCIHHRSPTCKLGPSILWAVWTVRSEATPTARVSTEEDVDPRTATGLSIAHPLLGCPFICFAYNVEKTV